VKRIHPTNSFSSKKKQLKQSSNLTFYKIPYLSFLLSARLFTFTEATWRMEGNRRKQILNPRIDVQEEDPELYPNGKACWCS
jgi:hypothetical protein